MKLREVFRYELRYRLRSVSTWIYGLILFLFALWVGGATADGGSAEIVNAPERIAGLSVIIGLLGMLVSAALFGDATVRDVQVEMDPLLFTSPLRKTEYLGGRFLAALLINAVLLVAIPLGLLVVTWLIGSFDPGAVGPFRVATYAQPYLLFQLPNLVLVGAVLFAIGALARKTLPVYFGAIVIFIAYLFAASFWDLVQNPILSALADPFGIGALEAMTRYWPAVERNSRLVGFPAGMVWNRVIWLAVAAGVLALLSARFRFAHAGGGRRWRKGMRRTDRGDPLRPAGRGTPVGGTALGAPVEVPRAAGSFGIRTVLRQTFAVTRNALAEVMANGWFAAFLLVAMGFAVLGVLDAGESPFETSRWPVTVLVIENALDSLLAPITLLFIAIYAGELVWKDRRVGVAEIADAAPVAEGVALLGRFLALVAALAMFLAAIMAGGILVQIIEGYYHFELGLYARVLFGLYLADLLLLGALAMTIHVVVNQKYIGHILALIACVSTIFLPQSGIVRHHLLVYGTDPGWTYSDMNGFGPFIGPLVWFNLYWVAWALLLAVVGTVFWVRGREPGVRYRLAEAVARFTGPVARTGGAAITLIVLLGGFIFYNTNILHEYRTADEAGEPQAEYERRYKRFEDVAQPTIATVQLDVEIYPDEPAVDLGGTYHLTNRTNEAIDSLHVIVARGVEVGALSFDRPAEPVIVDDEIGYRIYALGRALEPGDSLELEFDVSFRPRGFTNGRSQTNVAGNGTYFGRQWLPMIGYQPALELYDEDARERLELGPRPPPPSLEDTVARRYRNELRDADLVHVETVIGTVADQIAVTPGVLRESWQEDGRRYFRYETESLVPFSPTVFSAQYAVLEDRWNDVDLRIYHHPTHGANLDRVVSGMKASLEYYTQQYGPYMGTELRVLEIPRYGSFGRAHPHNIAFTEGIFISNVKEGELDQPFFGTAHEVAHMWWGGQVHSAMVFPGAGFISESLANYSGMMIVEKTYGLERARDVYDYQMDRYLRMRGGSGDVPLLEVENHPHISYGKGAVAMYTLREHLGEETVNAALRRFLDEYRDAGPPYPTSHDLFDELRAATPDSLQYLLTDLFETITLWDVRAEQAVVEPSGTGEYRVSLDVVARKVRADSVGNETEVPMDDLVEIGLFAPRAGEGGGEDGGGGAGAADSTSGRFGLGEPLYLRCHRIRSGAQTITITVPREPDRAGIDPYRKLIDRQRGNNVVEVEPGGAMSGDLAIWTARGVGGIRSPARRGARWFEAVRDQLGRRAS